MTSSSKPCVYVVDDDAEVRESLVWLLETVDLDVRAFATGAEFFQTYDDRRPGCLVLDVRLPEFGGVQVLQRLNEEGMSIPVIMVTGYGDVPTTVRAMKAGAVDVLEKPFNQQQLLDLILQSIERDTAQRRTEAEQTSIQGRLNLLTAREREILEMVVAGGTTKTIAEELGIARKTVETHRARLMDKLAARNAADLVRMAMAGGVSKNPDRFAGNT